MLLRRKALFYEASSDPVVQLSFSQLVIGSSPEQPHYSKKWKAHVSEDFRFFFARDLSLAPAGCCTA